MKVSRLFIAFDCALGLLLLLFGLLRGALIESGLGLALLVGPVLFRVLQAVLRKPPPSRPATPRRARSAVPHGLAYRAVTILVIGGMLLGLLPPLALAAASPSPNREDSLLVQPTVQPAVQPAALSPQRPSQPSGVFWADLDGDRDVDEGDLQQIAQFWNCAAGDPCYAASLDFNADNLIDAHDMAYVGNEYDISPPSLTVTSPANGAVIGGADVNVTGVISDRHAVQVAVNGVAATLVGQDFSATVPVTAGNQALQVVATDAVGQVATGSRVVGVDADGPMIEVHTPEHRQSVYTLRPTKARSRHLPPPPISGGSPG